MKNISFHELPFMQAFFDFLISSLAAFVSHSLSFLRLSVSILSAQLQASAEVFLALKQTLNSLLNFLAAVRHPCRVALYVLFMS